ncbi:MAG: hypothetical protein J0M18_14835 [Ignavibacteria bacterium]|nr:hypothetical protein [Ignavibacteria bacterium]
MSDRIYHTGYELKLTTGTNSERIEVSTFPPYSAGERFHYNRTFSDGTVKKYNAIIDEVRHLYYSRITEDEKEVFENHMVELILRKDN